MTKKFLAVTIVLVLVAGFAAVAVEQDDRPFFGNWENELTLDPSQDNLISAFDSTLTVNYTSGGINYKSVSEFTLERYTDQQFSIETTVGLLDLSSTIDFDPQDVNVFQGPDMDEEPAHGSLLPGSEHEFGENTEDMFPIGLQPLLEDDIKSLIVEGEYESITTNPMPFQSPKFDYWKNDASLTLGGVSLSLKSLLQRWDWNEEDTWPTMSNPIYRLLDLPAGQGVFADYLEPDSVTVNQTSGGDMFNDHFWAGYGFYDRERVNVNQFVTRGDVIDRDIYEIDREEGTASLLVPELTGSFGSGFELKLSGETPGGVSVNVTNQFGIMPKSDAESNLQAMLDKNVETGMMNYAGAVAFSNVTGLEAAEWLAITANAAREQVGKFISDELYDGVYAGVDESTFTQEEGDPTDPDSQASEDIRTFIRDYISDQAVINDVPSESGYVNYLDYRKLLAQLDWNDDPDVNEPVLEDMWLDGEYGLSAFPYYGTTITLEGQNLGCCAYTSETRFTEQEGFKYTKFEFELESADWPLTLDGDLKFTSDTKSIELTPVLDIKWACFSVYTDLSGTLANNSTKGSTITGLEVLGFGLEDVELGHVSASSYTALGDYMLEDLNDLDSSFEHAADYDEVFRIEKSDSLSLIADAYFDMTESSGLFNLGLFDLETSFAVSDQFTLGSGVEVSPAAGFDNFTLTADYSW